MTDQPLVSVHMITYNHAPFIERAVRSVVQQRTDFPFELVIGEDCSTDATREIVTLLAAEYPDIIRVLPASSNLGMRLNSNRTTDACRGKYIAWCEGDDFWQRLDKLALQASYLETYPDCGLVHSDHDRIFLDRGLVVPSFFAATGNRPGPEADLFRGWNDFHVLTCTAMARADLVHHASNDPVLYRNPNFRGAGDVPLFIEICLQSRCHYIDESLATYNVHADSVSRSTDPARSARFVLANVEARLYLAQKHELHEQSAFYSRRLPRSQLWVAFFEQNPTLADEAWSKISVPKLMDRWLHTGARHEGWHRMLHPILTRYLDWRARPPQGWFRRAVPLQAG